MPVAAVAAAQYLLRLLAAQAVAGKVELGKVVKITQRLVLLIRAVAAAVDAHKAALGKQAAPALSSSSTTSALPRSSPSSHRRSGLHQRVLSALTTSL
jgi:small ligand-binding sensory domain FIST